MFGSNSFYSYSITISVASNRKCTHNSHLLNTHPYYWIPVSKFWYFNKHSLSTTVLSSSLKLKGLITWYFLQIKLGNGDILATSQLGWVQGSFVLQLSGPCTAAHGHYVRPWGGPSTILLSEDFFQFWLIEPKNQVISEN